MNGSLDNHPKGGCVFAIVVFFILPHAEFGRNDRQEDAPHFICVVIRLLDLSSWAALFDMKVALYK